MTHAESGVPVPWTAGQEPSDEPVLEWSFNPWRERPGASAVAAVGAFGMCVLVLGLGLPFVADVGLCLALVSTLAPVLAPTRCRVDARGVARRGPLGWARRDWPAIRRSERRAAGLLVSPFPRPHWLDAYRALFLPFPAALRRTLAGETERRLALHGF